MRHSALLLFCCCAAEFPSPPCPQPSHYRRSTDSSFQTLADADGCTPVVLWCVFLCDSPSVITNGYESHQSATTISIFQLVSRTKSTPTPSYYMSSRGVTAQSTECRVAGGAAARVDGRDLGRGCWVICIGFSSDIIENHRILHQFLIFHTRIPPRHEFGHADALLAVASFGSHQHQR